MRTCRPYSASVIAHATSFCYAGGVLVHSNGHEVRVLDVHHCGNLERVISRQAFINQLRLGLNTSVASSDSNDRLSILGYSDGVAAVLLQTDLVRGSWLFAVNVRESRGGAQSRFLLLHRLTSVARLFVRHTASYLYFGTYSVLGRQGHHEWLIQGFDLSTGSTITGKPIQLTDFVAPEVGVTAAFEIHGECFYAVSNQSSHESEEVDWTSYYNCICFALCDPNPDTGIRTIYRRQHREGPINDAFTTMSLQIDQTTNELLIVECRKEWLGGGSTTVRSYYIAKCELSENDQAGHGPSYDPQDPLARTIDECSNSRYEPEKRRIPRHVHHDYAGDKKYDFIRAKTKYHAYNTRARSFLDLVSQDVAVTGSTRSRERLLLRVASRIPDSPLEPDPENPRHLRPRKPQWDKECKPVENSEEDFHPTEAYLWPPRNAPEELFEILCPRGTTGVVNATSDDRSIIYMASQSQANSNGERPIVMISFDPTWGFKGMKRWEGSQIRTDNHTELEALQIMDSHSSLKRRVDDSSGVVRDSLANLPDWSSSSDTEPAAKRQCCTSTSSTAAAETTLALLTRPRHFWKEKAKYLAIEQGFWLR